MVERFVWDFPKGRVSNEWPGGSFGWWNFMWNGGGGWPKLEGGKPKGDSPLLMFLLGAFSVPLSILVHAGSRTIYVFKVYFYIGLIDQSIMMKS